MRASNFLTQIQVFLELLELSKVETPFRIPNELKKIVIFMGGR